MIVLVHPILQNALMREHFKIFLPQKFPAIQYPHALTHTINCNNVCDVCMTYVCVMCVSEHFYHVTYLLRNVMVTLVTHASTHYI